MHLKFLGVVLLVLINTIAAPIPVLIVDGQNNHDFRPTTPHLQKLLEETGLFKVEVLTTPAKGGDMSTFKPKFGQYKVIVSNYNGEPWSAETRDEFVRFVRDGGGFVSVHAADNSFPNWAEYNQMTGLGGWEGRSRKSGPYLRLRENKWVHDNSPGASGHHGKQHEFVMTTRAPDHPIMSGLPATWLHAKDELYDQLRGPATNITVLASAFSSKESGGTGEHEPLLMSISFGKGRIFHTALGHNNGSDLTSQRCLGFITTFQRGVEWAATGKVTQKVPRDFPSETEVRLKN